MNLQPKHYALIIIGTLIVAVIAFVFRNYLFARTLVPQSNQSYTLRPGQSIQIPDISERGKAQSYDIHLCNKSGCFPLQVQTEDLPAQARVPIGYDPGSAVIRISEHVSGTTVQSINVIIR